MKLIVATCLLAYVTLAFASPDGTLSPVLLKLRSKVDVDVGKTREIANADALDAGFEWENAAVNVYKLVDGKGLKDVLARSQKIKEFQKQVQHAEAELKKKNINKEKDGTYKLDKDKQDVTTRKWITQANIMSANIQKIEKMGKCLSNPADEGKYEDIYKHSIFHFRREHDPGNAGSFNFVEIVTDPKTKANMGDFFTELQKMNEWIDTQKTQKLPHCLNGVEYDVFQLPKTDFYMDKKHLGIQGQHATIPAAVGKLCTTLGITGDIPKLGGKDMPKDKPLLKDVVGYMLNKKTATKKFKLRCKESELCTLVEPDQVETCKAMSKDPKVGALDDAEDRFPILSCKKDCANKHYVLYEDRDASYMKVPNNADEMQKNFVSVMKTINGDTIK